MTNHLAGTTSPYLLQHSNNPVDWYPWGSQALEKARREDRPIFLSIGYAACHWCHVMAHESFEDPETAALLNERFVSIKVDREERPDLDGIYMAAVTALTGQGGWPMSVFLTTDLQPFFGGTYFPPEPRHGLPAFREVLRAVSEAWQARRPEIDRTGIQLADRIREQAQTLPSGQTWSPKLLTEAGDLLVRSYDWQYGGWGSAPKFPQPMALDFLLRRHLAGDERALGAATHALEAMRRGGMYDVVGGGFARYSTDDSWRVPHFEKMLYDNAQLAGAYLHAWQVTGRTEFKEVVHSTLDFVTRELASPEGGFYSSLDADSEGEEGRFYAWTKAEIRIALGAEAEFFETAYAVTALGNWEGRTILQRALDDATLAARFGWTRERVAEKLTECHTRLLAVRSSRVRPATDDKVLTAWNGLALAVFAEAARVLDDAGYLQVAQRNADFLLTSLRPDGHLRRAWRKGQSGPHVFLDDYAALILGLLELYQTEFDNRWFAEARHLAEEMVERFQDPDGSGFFDTPIDSEPLLVRPKDLQDNAVPCGNALAAEALLKMSAYSGIGDLRSRAERTLDLVADPAARYPTAFGRWLSAADLSMSPIRQIAIVGKLSDPGTQSLLAEVRRTYRPNSIVAAAPVPPPAGSPALLADRPMKGKKPTAYVCEGFVCKTPVTDSRTLREQLDQAPSPT